MTLEARKKLAAHIQRILKVRRVSFLIATTDKGPLTLNYLKDAPDFEIVLDAVPLNMNDYDNRELKSLLEKYLFEKEEVTESPTHLLHNLRGGTENTPIGDMPDIIESLSEKKKAGRPAKSK